MNPQFERYPAGAAQETLAKRFNLPIYGAMQDWEWEVADATRFEEFFAAYSLDALNEDERFSLMEILVQCVEDSPLEDFQPRWSRIASLLAKNIVGHASTIEYWAQPEETETCALFRVSFGMRLFLTARPDIFDFLPI